MDDGNVRLLHIHDVRLHAVRYFLEANGERRRGLVWDYVSSRVGQGAGARSLVCVRRDGMGVFQDASLDVAVGIGVRHPGEFFDGHMESC